MSKPFTIVPSADRPGLFFVRVNAGALASYGARKPRNGALWDGWLVRPPAAPWEVIQDRLGATAVHRDDAVSLCHYLGRYRYGFGDLVFTYVDAPKGFFD